MSVCHDSAVRFDDEEEAEDDVPGGQVEPVRPQRSARLRGSGAHAALQPEDADSDWSAGHWSSLVETAPHTLRSKALRRRHTT